MTAITINTDAEVPAGYEGQVQREISDALQRLAAQRGVRIGAVNVQVGGTAAYGQPVAQRAPRWTISVEAGADVDASQGEVQQTVENALRNLATQNGVNLTHLNVAVRG